MRIAIVGAGASGLTSTKICLEYGFEPVCFEKSNDIGGLWRYKTENHEGQASVMKSTVINSSKEMMAFSDFVPKAENPNYMHNVLMMEYFRDYADHFNLLKYIRFRTEITKIKRAKDYEQSGRWTVESLNSEKIPNSEEFDAVLLCIGHHAIPYIPNDFPGIRQFRGWLLHSHGYKKPNQFEEKNVIVIGIGNSGGDIAVDLARVCNKVYLVSRRGCWVGNRIGAGGYPSDMLTKTRFYNYVSRTLPTFMNWLTVRRFNGRFDHEKYGLRPAHRPGQQHPTVNDDLPYKIMNGSVVIKPQIAEFTSNGCRFTDGSYCRNSKISTQWNFYVT